MKKKSEYYKCVLVKMPKEKNLKPIRWFIPVTLITVESFTIVKGKKVFTGLKSTLQKFGKPKLDKQYRCVIKYPKHKPEGYELP